MKKFKVGQVYKLSKDCVKWFYEHSDWLHSVGGAIQVKNNEQLLEYGLDAFSYPNGLDIYVLVEGNNGCTGSDFAYRCYFFNQLGEGSYYISPEHLESL